jgi:hypothetical protein
VRISSLQLRLRRRCHNELLAQGDVMEQMATDQRGPGSAGGDFPSDGAPHGSVTANASDWRASEVREGIELR